MSEKSRPLFTDDFLDELASEINALYGQPQEEVKQDNSIPFEEGSGS